MRLAFPSAVLAIDARLSAFAAHIDRWSRPRFVLSAVALAVLSSVFFFSPKLWLMNVPRPGTFEWDRALTFLQQCRAPFAVDIEPAMRWRLLPPLVANALGLSGFAPLLLPYVGLLALLATWCAVAERLLADRLAALLLTIVLGSTSAVITVTTWFGMNDAWFLLGLVTLTAGRSWPSLVFPGLLACWVDERFLLGWPAALFCRWWLQGRTPGFAGQVGVSILALAPYLAIRGFFSFSGSDRGASDFVSTALATVPAYISYAHIGGWMGFRASWLLVLLAPLAWWQRGSRAAFALGMGATLAGWAAVTLLAADLSRSTNLLLPLLLCGAVALREIVSAVVPLRRWLLGIALLNLLLPYLSVSYTKLIMVWPLPLELFRFWKA